MISSNAILSYKSDILILLLLALLFKLSDSLPQASRDPFPTQILSAYNSRSAAIGVSGHSAASGPHQQAARMNDNVEVQRHMQGLLVPTTTQNYNIGVIQVKLSNWTDHPLFKAQTPLPQTLTTESTRRRQSRLRNRDDHWRAIDGEGRRSENSSTYIFQTGNPKDRSRWAHVDNTYAYILIAIFLGLLIFLVSLYLFISCRSFCKRRHSRRRQPVAAFPSPYAYYESNPWGAGRGGGDLERLFRSDLERLFRSDLETKRPPLIAPPPPPPRVPPPPIPQHLRPHPTYTRRKYITPPLPMHRDSPVEREIRLQMLKRQISESTLSTRTRTNSF